MAYTKPFQVYKEDFNDYSSEDINIDYFELRDNGVICHYVKGGTAMTFAASDFDGIKAQWNSHFV